MERLTPQPTPINTRESSSSFEDAPRLVGQLNADGTASLDVDRTHQALQTKPPKSLKAALDAAARNRKGSATDTTSETGSEEDYDAMTQHPATVKLRSKGGNGDVEGINEKSYEELKGEGKPRPNLSKLKSIPVTLKKADEKGKYVLTADDKELRKILKSSVERENNPASTKRRSKFSDLVFTRQFTAFDRNNVDSAASPFHGFFVLFWLGIAIMVLRIAAANWKEFGNVLGTNEIMGMMFHRDVLVLGISDGVLCGVTGCGYILQKMILKGWLSWNGSGWLIQSAWELLYLFAFVGWTLFREWPWTHTVFFVLHGLVMLMKQHSYAFYLGHLSEVYKTRSMLQRQLKQLEKVVTVQTPSATIPAVSALSTSYLEHRPTASDLKQRRRSSSAEKGNSNIAQVAIAIESGEPLDVDQVQTFERILTWEMDILTEELKGKSTTSNHYYPNNVTFLNHYEYIVLPTLVYELSYPRSDSISWYYVAEKTAAVFGIIAIMNMVSQAYIYPVVVLTLEMKEAGLTIQQRLEAFPWILSDLVFPFMCEFMLSWYLIWEVVCNLLAELTFFADRGFYADWWNSTSWDQYARDWNRPVHNFLLRHVYHSSISSMRVNKYTATLITFFLSAVVHELVMWCLFKKLRGYLLLLQMCQIPLIQMSRSRWLKGKATLGNVIFWIGIFTGPSLLCSLYLII